MDELNNLNEFDKMEKFLKELDEVKNELENVKAKNEELITRLNSYTNRPSKNKNYYERHKAVLLEKKKQKYQEAKLKEELKDN